MTTEVVFRRGDIVRHSPAFMVAITKDHGDKPGDTHYEQISQAKGLVKGRYDDGRYHVMWDYEEGTPWEEMKNSPSTAATDMVWCGHEQLED